MQSSQNFEKQFKQVTEKDKTLVLDGSMGRYLYMEGGVPHHPTLWMLPALLEEKHHDAIVKAHKDYIAAGADVIQIFNYPCVPIFLKIGKCQDKIIELNETAARLARRAIKQSDCKDRKIWLAGALPTPGESYFHCHDMDESVFDETFKAIITGIDKYSDFFISQTIASSRDAHLIAKAAKLYSPKKILFMSFSVNEKCLLNSGETLTQAVKYLEEQKEISISGYGVNCCPFLVTGDCLKELRKSTEKSILAYPNFCEFCEGYKPSQSEGVIRSNLDIADEQYQISMKEILENNKGIIMMGGCCGFNPQKISLLRKLVPKF